MLGNPARNHGSMAFRLWRFFVMIAGLGVFVIGARMSGVFMIAILVAGILVLVVRRSWMRCSGLLGRRICTGRQSPGNKCERSGEGGGQFFHAG